MKNQNKWNKELLFSGVFLLAAILWFYLNPLEIIRNLIELSANELAIKQTIFNLGIFHIFYNVANIALAGSIIFLLCSVYAGISSLKKAPRL